MEIFQELTFTAFLALIFSFVLAMLVSFAVSNSSSDDNTAVCTVTEGAIAKPVSLNRGLRVKSKKSIKRVKFVDDIVAKRVDRFECENGSENLELLDDAESVGGLIIEKRSMDEKTIKRVDQFEDKRLFEDSEVKSSKKQCLDVGEINDTDINDKGSEIIELLIEKKCEGDKIMDGVFGEKEKTLVTSGQKIQVVEEEKNEVVLECDDMIIDQKEENGVVGSGENEGLSRGDVVEEAKERDESADEEDDDDDWEGIERSELEKVFAEAVNFVEYGGKGKVKDEDLLAKLDSDVQMQLYGLHKVAVEGPCREAQPMALMVSSRAKWNAWQRLGSMSQEEAMEQYIKILSDNITEWIEEYYADDGNQGSSKFVTYGDSGSLLTYVPEYERKLELSASGIGDSSTGPSHVEKGK